MSIPDVGSHMVKCHLGKYWADGPPSTHRSVIRALRHFLKFRKSQNEPIGEWGLSAVLIFFDNIRSIHLEKYDARVKKGILENSKSPAKMPAETHLLSSASAFRKFARVTGISYLIESDFGILLVEADGLGRRLPVSAKKGRPNSGFNIRYLGRLRFRR